MINDDIDRDALDPEEDDFLAFWAEHRARVSAPTRRILGVDVPVPDDMPLAFEATFAELEKSENMDDIKRLLGLLFSADVIDAWLANGVTLKMLQVLLAWGMSNAAGKAIEFREAAELVAQAEADKAANEGKAPSATNRAGRRASLKTVASDAAGGASSRTSRASTGKSLKTSR